MSSSQSYQTKNTNTSTARSKTTKGKKAPVVANDAPKIQVNEVSTSQDTPVPKVVTQQTEVVTQQTKVEVPVEKTKPVNFWEKKKSQDAIIQQAKAALKAANEALESLESKSQSTTQSTKPQSTKPQSTTQSTKPQSTKPQSGWKTVSYTKYGHIKETDGDVVYYADKRAAQSAAEVRMVQLCKDSFTPQDCKDVNLQLQHVKDFSKIFTVDVSEDIVETVGTNTFPFDCTRFMENRFVQNKVRAAFANRIPNGFLQFFPARNAGKYCIKVVLRNN